MQCFGAFHIFDKKNDKNNKIYRTIFFLNNNVKEYEKC